MPPVLYARLMASRCRLYMEPTTSDSERVVDEGHASSASEASDTSGATSRYLPTVKGNVKQGMFYC